MHHTYHTYHTYHDTIHTNDTYIEHVLTNRFDVLVYLFRRLLVCIEHWARAGRRINDKRRRLHRHQRQLLHRRQHASCSSVGSLQTTLVRGASSTLLVCNARTSIGPTSWYESVRTSLVACMFYVHRLVVGGLGSPSDELTLRFVRKSHTPVRHYLLLVQLVDNACLSFRK